MPLYVCSLPNPGEPGVAHECITDDPKIIEAFVRREDKPGRGVYYCVSPLKPGARRRSLKTIREIPALHIDVDGKDIVEDLAAVDKRLSGLPLPPTEIRNSGHGRHVVFALKEPIAADDAAEAARATAVLKELTRYLCGDPAVAHHAALLRQPGSHNSKNGEWTECQTVLMTGARYDLGDIEDWLGDVDGRTLFTRRDVGNGHDKSTPVVEHKPPLDIDARLAAMRWHGPGDSGIHTTQLSTTASLLRAGVTVEETVRIVFDATVAAVAGDPDTQKWDWRREQLSIRRMCIDFVWKNPELAVLLPEAWQGPFATTLAAGRRPDVGFNGVFYMRSWGTKAAVEDDPATASSVDRPKTKAAPIKRVLVLRPFEPFDVALLPPRSWLYGKHYQRRTVSLTAGPGGMGKSSLDLVEAVAMATCRNLLGEQPEERLRVWYHNGEDPFDEIKRRVAAICQHYDISQQELPGYLFITSGNEFPLRVAKGYVNLEIDAELLLQISTGIADNQIDVATFDPLVTLHSVSEIDNGKMDTVIRLFAGIADAHDTAIELAHHVRKPAAGMAADYDVHDIRGVTAITDAVRAARLLNRMNEKDAEAAGCAERERLSRFRVDRAKGNYSPPQAATWRQFISVELINGDDVGVVAPWDFPGQGELTPERAAADQKAEHVFLQLLDKFLARGQNVSANSGPTYAPAKFFEEREAKTAKVSKAALKAAMTRLLDADRIRSEPVSGRNDRHKLVPWHGAPSP